MDFVITRFMANFIYPDILFATATFDFQFTNFDNSHL